MTKETTWTAASRTGSTTKRNAEEIQHWLATGSIDAATNNDDIFLKKLLQQIDNDLDARRFHKAVAYLARHIDLLLEKVSFAQIQARLTTVPAPFALSNADYAYCNGVIMSRIGQLTEAIEQLQRARTLYENSHVQSQTIRCIIDIARLYYSQEDFRQSFQYLADEAQPLLKQSNAIEPVVRAYYLLQMAHLATDIGQLHASTDYAQQALTLYGDTGDLQGQFRSQLRIARNFIQCGYYSEAHNRLQLVRQYFYFGKLGTTSEAQLLNAEIHLRWYQGHFNDAIRLAQLYLRLADHEQLRNARLYARILLANLHRDSQNFRCATHWYEQTQQLIHELDQQLYQPWLDAQQAWLYLLQDELEQALHHSLQSLQTTDWGQQMSFQVPKAVIHLLQGRITVAEKLLLQSLRFYEHSGDPLASCAIRVYLAYIALQREDSSALLVYLQQIFACFEEREINTLPHWWHPEIMAEVCCQAIVAGMYPSVVKEIITKNLGHQSTHALTKLLRTDDLDLRQQAQHLVGIITGQNMTILAHLEDSLAKQILQAQLESGHLRAEGYPHIEAALMTAKQRRHPNPTLLAVFVLHLFGVKRTAIAERLDCSVENVRNYITTIYHHFKLPASNYRSREERRQHLVKIARERGYIN
jgi:tetratricopeptide (TPR) repeat protein